MWLLCEIHDAVYDISIIPRSLVTLHVCVCTSYAMHALVGVRMLACFILHVFASHQLMPCSSDIEKLKRETAELIMYICVKEKCLHRWK